ncbi:response regulator [Actinoplanes sp. URMC 104]|uniref:response regulator n=1 Tax=Actinoplanes sp. URMC 104 TaxID=3423409 RepID=UPI003F1D5E0F
MPLVVAVEDDADIADLLSVVLRAAGYTVYTAPDGEQGLTLIDRHHPDLVILDHYLPGMTGMQVAQRLRAEPRTAALPLLMISTNAPYDATVFVDDVLTKPLRPRVLKAHVESMLATTRPGWPDPPSPVLDRRRLGALAGYDWDHPDLRRSVDAISQRTAARLGLPIGMANLVLDTAQFTIGSHSVTGWIAEADGTPLEWSFCVQTVTTGRPYVVPDATIDPVQQHNPLVTIDGWASYAGVPLIDHHGHVFGVHCVLDTSPHTFTETDLAELRAAADEIMALLQKYRLP